MQKYILTHTYTHKHGHTQTQKHTQIQNNTHKFKSLYFLAIHCISISLNIIIKLFIRIFLAAVSCLLAKYYGSVCINTHVRYSTTICLLCAFNHIEKYNNIIRRNRYIYAIKVSNVNYVVILTAAHQLESSNPAFRTTPSVALLTIVVGMACISSVIACLSSSNVVTAFAFQVTPKPEVQWK